MKIKISLLLLSICFSLNISAKTEYYELVDSAEVNIKEKRWDRAESFLKELLRSYPDDNNNSLIISNLATVQRYQGKVSEAIRNYSFAINMTPNAVTLLKNRASVYLEVDSVARALSDYDRILSLDEKDEESRYYHGILSLRVGNLDEAKLNFDYILYYNPASGLGREGLAHYNKIKKDYTQAIKYFTEIIEQFPSAILYSNRAECYLAQKRLNEAEKDIDKALGITPDDGYLYVLRAKLRKLRFDRGAMEADLMLAEKYGFSRELAEEILRVK